MNFHLSVTADLGSTSQGIDSEQWDSFMAFVHKLLEEHPIAQADTIMALKLGSSACYYYDAWQSQPMNIAKPLHVKVAYLLDYWAKKMCLASMREMVSDLDEKLKSEPSFDMMREQIKPRFLGK